MLLIIGDFMKNFYLYNSILIVFILAVPIAFLSNISSNNSFLNLLSELSLLIMIWGFIGFFVLLISLCTISIFYVRNNINNGFNKDKSRQYVISIFLTMFTIILYFIIIINILNSLSKM